LLVDALLDGEGKAAENPGDLAGSGVVAVSGIARPESFAKTLARIGVRVLAHEIFPDHARYTDSDADRIISSRAKTRADFIVATEKDAVKLSPFMATETFRFLRVTMKIDRPEDLTARLLAAVEMNRRKMNP
jgi:tetraacyldisaccharide 4'-kinase